MNRRRNYKLKSGRNRKIELIPNGYKDSYGGYLWIGDEYQCYAYLDHQDKLRKLAYGILKMIGDIKE